MEQSAKEYSSWRYLIFRIFQALEENIKNLKDIQADDYKNKEELENKEQSIVNLMSILNEILQWFPSLNDFEFPYFGQLLQLTSNIQVQRSLLLLCMNIFLNEQYKPKMMLHISSLFAYYTPFLRMFRKCDWDYVIMRDSLIRIFSEKTTEEPIPKSLEELMSAVLENSSQILTALKEHADLQTENQTYFANRLTKLICDHPDFEKKDSQKFYKAVGEANLAFFLLDKTFNEKFFAMLPLIICAEGNFKALKTPLFNVP